MKLTTKILKEMIRKELNEAKDPLGKKGGYFGRGLDRDARTQEKEKEFQDKIDAEEKAQAASIYRAIVSTVDDEYDYLSEPKDIDREEVVDYLKGKIYRIQNYFDDEEIYKLYLMAVEEYNEMY